jgi:formate dehydrogenase subunit gamma
VKPEASADPNYLKQTNGERNKVQPGNNAPMWRQVSGGVTGYSSLPVSEAPEAGNLIQGFVQYPGSRSPTPARPGARCATTGSFPTAGAALIVLLALAIFYFTRGPIACTAPTPAARSSASRPSSAPRTGPTPSPSSSLAISGIVMAFGKFFLLPVIGSALFGYLTYVLKTVHNFVGPLFVVSLVHLLHLPARQLAAARATCTWLRRGGGLFGGKRAGVAPLQCRREAGVLGRRVLPGQHRGRLGPGPGQAPARPRLRAPEMQVAHMVHAVATC